MTKATPPGGGFDYIIVGGGSAGCVLAGRLSENPRTRVLLIEAGPRDDSFFVRMPMGLFQLLKTTERSWHYMTEPEPSGKAHFWARGKMLGGSSSINGMLYFRGQPEDYDGWEAMGCRGWGWSEMSRVFRRLEDHELGDDGVRGVGGPLHISVQRERTPLTEALLQAGAAVGLPVKEDLNRPEQEGIGFSSRTIRNGRRVSAADAFLKPALRRPNLAVVTDTLVEKVLVENGRAIGVQARRGGASVRYEANREVILAAGALQSPMILQHSGIGPAEHLRSLGIPLLVDSPDVGGNLREHKMITMGLRVTGHSLNRELQRPRLYANVLRYVLTGGGPMAATYDINAFVRTRPELSRPDAQLTFWALSPDRESLALAPEKEPGLMVMGYPLRTDSQGVLRIRSPDPADPPTIRANFLTTEHDRRVIVDMFRYARRILSQPPLARFIRAETRPGPAVQTDAEILEAAQQDSTCLHSVGTCRMGADERSVVDDRLRVRGVDGLRVVDLSVMPTQVSGNPNGPVMALAWRAADLILAGANS